jgi:DNA-binding beta-propeller fold protein YncE
VAAEGTDLGQVKSPRGMAFDSSGNLYVTEEGNRRIQMRDTQGRWTLVARSGLDLGQVLVPVGVTVDAAGNLYVTEYDVNAAGDVVSSRVQKRDSQGQWSLLAVYGEALGQVVSPWGVAVDGAGDLYVADHANNRIQKRDPQGVWSIITAVGTRPGEVDGTAGVAVDAVGNLYITDARNNRLETYVTAASLLYGDLNADGQTNLADVALALRMIIGDSAVPSTGELLHQADVSPKNADGTVGDGIVDLRDVTRLLRRVVGLESDPWP